MAERISLIFAVLIFIFHWKSPSNHGLTFGIKLYYQQQQIKLSTALRFFQIMLRSFSYRFMSATLVSFIGSNGDIFICINDHVIIFWVYIIHIDPYATGGAHLTTFIISFGWMIQIVPSIITSFCPSSWIVIRLVLYIFQFTKKGVYFSLLKIDYQAGKVTSFTCSLHVSSRQICNDT